jgi:hypothetical protein
MTGILLIVPMTHQKLKSPEQSLWVFKTILRKYIYLPCRRISGMEGLNIKTGW